MFHKVLKDFRDYVGRYIKKDESNNASIMAISRSVPGMFKRCLVDYGSGALILGKTEISVGNREDLYYRIILVALIKMIVL